MNQNELSPKEKTEMRKLNRGLIVVVVFLILWITYLVIYVDKRTETFNNSTPIVMIDADTGKIIEFTNIVNQIDNFNGISPLGKQSSYNISDLVIVNFFNIRGVVTGKDGNEYVVVYKDTNNVLRKITLPVELLLSPFVDKGPMTN